jgi:hypothetical protein
LETHSIARLLTSNIFSELSATVFVQSIAKPASPTSAALKIFRRPAGTQQRLTKSSQALNSGAGSCQ